jgi:N-acetylneuraminic acid mutarotase
MTKIYILYICLFSLSFSFGAEVWNQKSSLPAVGRHRGTGISIGQKGYIGLGHMNGTGNNIIYKDWWEFDPATNSWTQKSDYPVGTYGASAFSVDSVGYVGGGTGLSNEFYKYSPANNTWTQISNALFSNPSDQTAFGINGKGYILDGTTLLEYKPSTDSWATKADCPITGWAITSFVIRNSAYVKVNNQMYEYKPTADEWIERAIFPGIITNGSAAFSVNNKGYIISGYSSFLNPVFSVMWEYDPTTNSWTQMPDFPGTSRRFGVGFSINNKGYFGSGTNGTNMNDFWEYNPTLKGLGTNENEIDFISVFPKPANETVNFNLKIYENDYLLNIFDFTGKLIKSIHVNQSNYQLERNNLPSGIYYYSLRNKEKVITNGSFIYN